MSKLQTLMICVVSSLCLMMGATFAAQPVAPASSTPQSALVPFLQAIGLEPTHTIGGVTLGGRYDSTFGAIGEVSYGAYLSDEWAAGLLGEYGPNTYRINATIGRQLWQDAQVKFTAEYLDQKLPFTFDAGSIDRRVQQSAYGLQLLQQLDNAFLRSIHGGAYMAVAPGKALSAITIINNGLAYTNERNIAGSTSSGFDIGADMALSKTTLLNGKVLYDDIRYDTRYVSGASLNRSGLGGSLELNQLVNDRLTMSLKAENRSLIDTYGTELRWHPEDFPLNIGLTAGRVLTNDSSPSSTLVGINFNLALNDETFSSPVETTPGKTDLLSWTKTPAVRMERVQVREDQRTTLSGPVTLSISPSSGPVTGGGTVTITGTNFLPGVVVTFSGVNATVISVTSTQIVVTVPDLSLVVVENTPSFLQQMWAQMSFVSSAHAATSTRDVTVVVTNPDGKQFTFQQPYVTTVEDPIVTAVTPNTGPIAGGTSVTLTGSVFTGATSVTLGGVAATALNVVNDTTLTFTTPAHAAGAVDIIVITPQGQVTSSGAFTYINPVPTLASISPVSGSPAGGGSVTLTGTNLTGTTSVTFGGVAATSVTVINATTVTAITPAHAAGAVDIIITTPDGSGTLSNGYTYETPAPTVTGISPSSGSMDGGTSVTITGTDFTGATAVNFGSDAAASFTIDSATTITAISPAATAGTVDVTVTTPSGTSPTSSADQFTFTGPPIIFVTNSTYNGNLNGFSGADAKCNSDANKPSTGFAANYTYKALLNGNNATISGVTYYRPNGTTQIATATGGNLVGSSSLINAITSTSGLVWTGSGGSSCSNWSTSSAAQNAFRGSATSTTSTYWSNGSALCNTLNRLYCVSQ